jgi:fused signal recognition particle receptor
MAVAITIVVVVLLVAAAGLVGGMVLRRRWEPPRTQESAAVRPPIGPERARRPTPLGPRLRELLGSVPGDEEWARLEEALIRADVGPGAAADLVARVRARFSPSADPEELLRAEIVTLLGPDAALELPDDRLAVVMVVGVNGSGKTTTIGKLAAMLGRDGRRVTLAASDTFRAAAGEQIEAWAERSGAQLVAQARGADPGSVAFDAVRSATAKGSDVLVVDTAGRLHTRTPLMDELGKVKRVIEKAGAKVDETVLVLDASTGQNGVAQARAFLEAVDVTGVVLTKMDGTARGGIALVVRTELGVPVKLVGTGEELADLEPFRAEAFAERLLSA